MSSFQTGFLRAALVLMFGRFYGDSVLVDIVTWHNKENSDICSCHFFLIRYRRCKPATLVITENMKSFSNWWPCNILRNEVMFIINVANIYYFAPWAWSVPFFVFLFHHCCHGNPIQNGCLADWGSDVQLALLTPADAPPSKSLQSSQFGRNSSGNHLNLRIRSNGRTLTLPFGKIIFLNWWNFVKGWIFRPCL